MFHPAATKEDFNLSTTTATSVLELAELVWKRCAPRGRQWWWSPWSTFKAYRKDFLERTPIESAAGFALALELTVKAHFGGDRIEELPATWRDRTAGTSRFRLWAWLPLYLRWFGWALRRRWLGTPAAKPRG